MLETYKLFTIIVNTSYSYLKLKNVRLYAKTSTRTNKTEQVRTTQDMFIILALRLILSVIPNRLSGELQRFFSVMTHESMTFLNLEIHNV